MQPHASWMPIYATNHLRSLYKPSHWVLNISGCMQYTQAQICLDFGSEVLTAYQINVTACQPCDLLVQRPAKQTSAKYMLCIVSVTCRLTLMLDVQAAQLWLQYISLLAGVNQSNQPNSFLLQMVLMAKIKLNLLPTSVASP